MPVAGSEPVDPSLRAGDASPLGELTAALRDFGRRRRGLITVVGSLATAAVLVFLLAGRRHEFAAAISDVAGGVLAVTVLLQIVALLARSEAWHLTIQAAGRTVDARASAATSRATCSPARAPTIPPATTASPRRFPSLAAIRAFATSPEFTEEQGPDIPTSST